MDIPRQQKAMGVARPPIVRARIQMLQEHSTAATGRKYAPAAPHSPEVRRTQRRCFPSCYPHRHRSPAVPMNAWRLVCLRLQPPMVDATGSSEFGSSRPFSGWMLSFCATTARETFSGGKVVLPKPNSAAQTLNQRPSPTKRRVAAEQQVFLSLLLDLNRGGTNGFLAAWEQGYTSFYEIQKLPTEARNLALNHNRTPSVTHKIAIKPVSFAKQN